MKELENEDTVSFPSVFEFVLEKGRGRGRGRERERERKREIGRGSEGAGEKGGGEERSKEGEEYRAQQERACAGVRRSVIRHLITLHAQDVQVYRNVCKCTHV